MACADAGDANYGGNIEVRLINDEVGRGLFCCRDFKKGETIIVERPLGKL